MGSGVGKEDSAVLSASQALTPEEIENLRIRFAYPEKYWKLANYYYTHNKAWISEKNVEKLERLWEQMEKWRNFVESVLTV